MVPVLFLGFDKKSGPVPNWTEKWFEHFHGLKCNGASRHQVSVHLPVSEAQLKQASWDWALVEPLHDITSCL